MCKFSNVGDESNAKLVNDPSDLNDIGEESESGELSYSALCLMIVLFSTYTETEDTSTDQSSSSGSTTNSDTTSSEGRFVANCDPN